MKKMRFINKVMSQKSGDNSTDCLNYSIARIGVALMLLLLIAAGCGEKYISTSSKAVLPTGKVRLAILPLENLTTHHNAGMIGAELLISELHSRGRFDVVPFSEVREVMEQQDILRADRMKNVVAKKIGEAVAADLVMTGTVAEYGYQFGLREEPSVSMNLRLARLDNGAIVWTHSAGLVRRGVSVSMAAQSLVKKMADVLLSE
jgi:hypothetical protein